MSQLLALASQLSSTPSTVLTVFGSYLQEAPLAQVASGVVAVAVFTYLFKRIRARPLLDDVPEPVRPFPMHRCVTVVHAPCSFFLCRAVARSCGVTSAPQLRNR